MTDMAECINKCILYVKKAYRKHIVVYTQIRTMRDKGRVQSSALAQHIVHIYTSFTLSIWVCLPTVLCGGKLPRKNHIYIFFGKVKKKIFVKLNVWR